MSRVLLTGLAAFAVFGTFIYVAVNATKGVPLRDYGTVYTTVPQIGNLLTHDPVRIAGVRVGQVADAVPIATGGARVKLQLEPGTRLPDDTRVAVRGNGLLGARYIQLIPGTSKTDLPEGGALKGDENAYTFGVPETIDTFDARTRGALGAVVRELGTGFIGRGDDINDALRITAPEMPRVPLLVDSVLRRPGAAAALLPALDGATRALDASARDLARLTTPVADALGPLVTERAALRDTLTAAPGALAQADAGLAEGRRLLTATRSLTDAVQRTLPPAPEGLRATATLLRTSSRPLARATTLLRTGRAAVPAALRITSALSPVLKPADEALRTLAPMAVRIGQYKCDIVNFASVFRSMTGFGGTGEGPNGPAMQFRLQAVGPLPTEVLGIADTTGLTFREGYSRPCQFPPTTYPVVNPRTLGEGGR